MSAPGEHPGKGKREFGGGRGKRLQPFFYLGGIALTFAVSIFLLIMFLHPPPGDLGLLALYMSGTAVGSALIGFLAQRFGWWRRLPGLNQGLLLGYAVGALLTLLNVWITMRMMFISEHDLRLGALLLLFAGGISVSFGYFFSTSLTQTLDAMGRAAQRISEGDFAARVDESGQDEVARLAGAFNQMAARLQQMAAETERLDQARRDLVAWASHDLRTPLSSLRAMIDALVDGVVADDENTSRYLRQSQAEINRMSALIDDLFDLAQLDAGEPTLDFQEASLSDLVSDTLAAFSARARAGNITLDGSVEPGTDPVWMAPDKIGRVLGNLIENAIRYTPPGGQIQVRAARLGEGVEVRVEDSGPGIAEADLPHIFDPFYRGEKSRSRKGYGSGGAGLGLAIARRLVEAHGGRIEADSLGEMGLVMRFTLRRTPTLES